MQKSKKVLFIMSGSIACYKAAQVISRLVQNDIQVQVVASPSALQFIGKATLEGLSGRPVVSDLFQDGHAMDHIHLIREADLILLAPATANTINKMAQGLGDDLISTLFLAHDFKKPFLIAPAMNTSMYNHPITQNSLQKLKAMGLKILDSASGILACGEVGYGKLLEPDLILKETLDYVHQSLGQSFSKNELGKIKTAASSAGPTQNPAQLLKVLITAGGTQEKIDAVRRITNTSTGQTGLEIAQTLHSLGAEVQLLMAESSPFLEKAKDIFPDLKTFSDHESLHALMQSELAKDYQSLIHAAAVSDYTVSEIRESDGRLLSADDSSKRNAQKISSAPKEITLKLHKTKKLIAEAKKYSKNKNIFLVGFKLTSGLEKVQWSEKVENLMHTSGCDLVIHNDILDWGSEQRIYNIFLKKHGQQKSVGHDQNEKMSHQLMQNINKDEMKNILSQLIFENFNPKRNSL